MSSAIKEIKDPLADIMSEIEVLHHQAVQEAESAPKKPPILPRTVAKQEPAPSAINSVEAELAAEFGIDMSGELNSEQISEPKIATNSEPATIAAEPPISLNELEAELNLVQASANAPAEAIVNDDSAMADFRSELGTGGSSEEGSLEDTLGSMKEEESGKVSIFDASASVTSEEEDLSPIPDPSLSLVSVHSVAEVIPMRPAVQPSMATETIVTAPVFPSAPTPVAVPSADSSTGAEGVLSMTLQGKMALNLKYAFEGHEVLISFNEDALKIQLQDGAEFKVPLKKKSE